MPLPKLISCKVMIEEIRSLTSGEIATEVFEISLHTRPAMLRDALQKAIDASDGIHDPILLGYGMCSKATVGLRAKHSRLVVPKSDDCIAIFLGSKDAHREQMDEEPGTYFLTRGWIGGGGGSVFSEHERMVAKYGAAKASILMDKMLAHYKRVVYIHMPNSVGCDSDRDYAQATADRYGMKYVEIKARNNWLAHLVDGRWDEDCIVVQPGEEIKLEHFLESRGSALA